MKIQKWFVETIQLRVQLTPHTGLSARREKIVLFVFAVTLVFGTASLKELQAQQPKPINSQQNAKGLVNETSRSTNREDDFALVKRIVLFPVLWLKNVGRLIPGKVKREPANKELNMTAKPANLQHDFTLEGTLIKSELEEDGSSIYVHLRLQFYLTNIARDSLLFRKQDNPIFIGLALSKTARFEQGDLIEKYVGGPSIDVSDDWRRLREALNTEAPSETVVRELAPSETWSFVEEATIVTTKKAGLQNQLTLEKLRASSPIWMKVFFEVWSPNIEPNVEQPSDLKFGKALRKRWRKYGYLFLDDISSAPIMVDLSAPIAARHR